MASDDYSISDVTGMIERPLSKSHRPGAQRARILVQILGVLNFGSALIEELQFRQSQTQ